MIDNNTDTKTREHNESLPPRHEVEMCYFPCIAGMVKLYAI